MVDNPRINELRRRVHADPASIAFAQLAEECRRAGANDEAVTICRNGLARHPGYLSARVTLGRALIELGELDDARHELDIVVLSAPDNMAAIRGLAEICQQQGKLDEALEHYRHALTLASHDADLEDTVDRISQAIAPPLPVQPADVPAVAVEELFDFDKLLAELGEVAHHEPEPPVIPQVAQAALQVSEVLPPTGGTDLRPDDVDEFAAMERELRAFGDQRAKDEQAARELRALEDQRLKDEETQRRLALEEQRLKEAEAERRLALEAQRLLELEEQQMRELEAARQPDADEQLVRELEEARLAALEDERLRALELQRLEELEMQRLRELEDQQMRELEAERQRDDDEQLVRELEEARLKALEEDRVRALELQPVEEAPPQPEVDEQLARELEAEQLKSLEEDRLRALEVQQMRAREEAAREEAARDEAAREEAARDEAAREEAARVEATHLEALRLQQELEAQRLREAEDARRMLAHRQHEAVLNGLEGWLSAIVADRDHHSPL